MIRSVEPNRSLAMISAPWRIRRANASIRNFAGVLVAAYRVAVLDPDSRPVAPHV
jgi:hypothetical protein